MRGHSSLIYQQFQVHKWANIAPVKEISSLLLKFLPVESKNNTGKVACTKCLFSIEKEHHTEPHGSKLFRVVPPDQMSHPVLILFDMPLAL